MKKVFFCAAALMAGTVAFAQDNGSTVTQTGNDNETVVMQTGELHSSTITQTGNNDYAWVRQEDDNNTSNITQGPNGFLNVAYVTQLGTGQMSTITQSSSAWTYSNVEQYGNDNTSIITQGGDDDDATVYQNGSGHESEILQDSSTLTNADGNIANVQQHDDSHYSFVDQTGFTKLNLATIEQRGLNHSSNVTQLGDSNTSTVTQTN